MSAAALDPSYAAAAARKARGEGRADTRRVPARLVTGLLLVGLGTGVVTAQVRQHASQLDDARRRLVADVKARTAETDRLAGDADRLRAQVAALRTGALGVDAQGRALAAQLAALEDAADAVAVSGPGLVVTLDDAHGSSSASARGGQSGQDRIYDSDIQNVVNALWAAGAEAISVDDMRVTTTTAIRSAGEAVLVDLRPLSPPYRIRAIGDVNRMEPAFVQSKVASSFQTWVSVYGLGFSVHRASHLVLPAAVVPVLHVAAPGTGPTPSPRPSVSGGSP